MICLVFLLQTFGGIVMASDNQVQSTSVVPINWSNFSGALPTDQSTLLEKQVLQNSNKYALNKWWNNVKGYASQTGQYLTFGGTDEKSIRPGSDEALALATSLKLGLYDANTTGVSFEDATQITTRLIASIAYRHKANLGSSGWGGPKSYVPTSGGDGWQTALWASSTAYAGWLMWDDLSAADREYVRKMIEYEANRFLNFTVPYYADRDGNIVYPGDTKAEENAWNAYSLGIAMAMMPNHPNYQAWLDKYSELMISAFAKPSDLNSDEIFHGQKLSDWLHGYNILENGLLYNHHQIHPDYMVTNGSYFFILAGRMLANEPLLKAEFLNNSIVYYALSDLKDEYGKTIYQDDGTIYYQKLDWGNGRRMNFVLFDAVANIFGFDENSTTKAADWELKHVQLAVAQQERFTDGRTYDPTAPEDSFHGAEEIVASRAANIFLIKYAMAQDNIDKTIHNDVLDINSAQDIANTITSLTISEDKIVMPQVPHGFSVEIASSDDTDTIGLDGSVNRKSSLRTVNLTLKVTRNDETPTSAFTSSIPVIVEKKSNNLYDGNLLNENFENATTDDWRLLSTQGGSWKINEDSNGNHSYRQTDTSANKARAIIGDKSWTDYELEFKMYINSAAASASGTGFYFRYNDGDNETDVTNAYYVSFYNGNSNDSGAAIKLIKYAGSTTANVIEQIDYSKKPISFNTWHTIKAVANGNHIELWVDNAKMIEADDSENSNPSGRIALYAHRTDVSFDNVKVTPYGLEVSSTSYSTDEFTPSGKVDLTAAIRNTSFTKTESADLILALYDSTDKLIDIDIQSVNMPPDTDDTEFNVSILLPSNPSGCYLKYFLWDSLSGCKPLYISEKFPE